MVSTVCISLQWMVQQTWSAHDDVLDAALRNPGAQCPTRVQIAPRFGMQHASHLGGSCRQFTLCYVLGRHHLAERETARPDSKISQDCGVRLCMFLNSFHMLAPACVYAHVYIPTYIYIYIIYKYAIHMYTYMYRCIWIHTYTHVCLYMYTHMSADLCAHIPARQ